MVRRSEFLIIRLVCICSGISVVFCVKASINFINRCKALVVRSARVFFCNSLRYVC